MFYDFVSKERTKEYFNCPSLLNLIIFSFQKGGTAHSLKHSEGNMFDSLEECIMKLLIININLAHFWSDLKNIMKQNIKVINTIVLSVCKTNIMK